MVDIGRVVGRRAVAPIVAVLALAGTVGLAPNVPAAPPSATLALSKNAFVSGTNDPLTASVTPGDTFDYQLSASCSGLTEGCINATTVDVLPPGIVFNGAASSPLYTVTYNAATRTVTTVYNDVLPAPPNPPGSKGIPAGSTRIAVLHVSLDPATTAPDGSTITNAATASADNADPATDSTDITVSVPRTVTPIATKAINPASVIAGSGANVTATLSVRNGSSASADVTSLTVDDPTKATWDAFDLVSVGPVSEFPTGADQVAVRYCLDPAPCSAAQFVTGPFVPGPDLALPGGVDPAAVTGIGFVFRDSNGTVIPPSPTTAIVPVDLILRDTVRSTGAPLQPTTALSVRNCASPSAVDAVDGAATGADACATVTVQPGTAQIRGSKQFFPDEDGVFAPNGYAVAGQGSQVSALTKVENDSAIPVNSLTISDPSTTAPGSLASVVGNAVRLVFPAGAAAATGSITCSNGTALPITATATTTVPIGCPAGTRATEVTVTYTGTIPPGASGQLGIRGTLDGTEVAGSSLQDCADGAIRAGQSESTLTTCAQLPVEAPRTADGGVKNVTSPQTGGALVPGFPVTFTLQAGNSGNLPLNQFTLTDPPAGTAPAANPFTALRLNSVNARSSPPALIAQFAIEVTTDNGLTWQAYDPANTALLPSVDGVRARLTRGVVAPTQGITLTLNAQLRDGVPPGTSVQNCQRTDVASTVGAATSGNVCAPQLTSELPATQGDLAKFVVPGTLPAPIPGVSRTAQVQLRARNTGNVPLRQIIIVDPDPGQADVDAFFEQVDVTRIDGVNFPPGANRVQVDACLTAAACRAGTYASGTPTGSTTPGLPPGVTAADVAGLRFTFTNSSGGFDLTPGSNFARGGACPNATACFSVTPRTTERTAGTPIAFPTSFSNIAVAQGESPLAPGLDAEFGTAPAPLEIAPGAPQLKADKTADAANATTVSPGQPISYALATTNTGTAAVPALSIVEPLPPGLNFDNTFNGDNGQPFRVTATVPTGTPQPPAPTFTAITDPATNRITELRWQYPESFAFYPTSTITISFQARLDPTVAAGTRIDNTYGATTTDTTVLPKLSCATGAPGPLGCTDGASATAGTGNAVDAQKWVHGDDSRGFYNTRTKAFVAIGDAGCPLLTVGGNSYTRFPCIALVLAGQNFDFLLNVTNVGTTPITETRLVDYLPKLGDRGVVVNGARETEWDPRPVLAAAPTLAPGSPGALALAYSATSPTCTTDIAKPPVPCPAGTWSAAFSADAEAFRGFLTFATPLPPAGTTRIVVPMSAPANLDTTTNQLPIAWNSFAHSDFFQQPNGSITQLPPVEPEKVGVALPFGNLQIDKVVTGPIPPGSIIGPFRGTYSCVVTTAAGNAVTVSSGDAEFSPVTPFTVSHVSAGAVCTITETDNGGGNPTVPAPVTIRPDTDASVPAPTVATVTNDFPAPRLLVTKALTGDAARYAVGPFTITVNCTAGGDAIPPRTLTFAADGTQSITDLPIGAQCTIAEADTRGATSTSTSYSNGDHATISALVDGVAELTNTYDAAELTVTKRVAGSGAAGPYSFIASCTVTSNAGAVITVPLAPADGAFTLSNGEDRVITVPQGAACVVTEVTPPTGDVVSYNGARTSTAVSVAGATTLAIVNTFAPAVPPNPPAPPIPPAPPVAPEGGGLALTGAPVVAPLAIGLLLLAAGALLWLAARRKPRPRDS